MPLPPRPGDATHQPRQTVRSLLRQYERLRVIGNQLTRAGKLNADATPEEVIACIRRLMPEDLE
jgi:hypothetical protein